jgi:hypothetical protein
MPFTRCLGALQPLPQRSVLFAGAEASEAGTKRTNKNPSAMNVLIGQSAPVKAAERRIIDSEKFSVWCDRDGTCF